MIFRRGRIELALHNENVDQNLTAATNLMPDPGWQNSIWDHLLLPNGRKMAEVATPRQMFQEILRLIAELRPPPALA
jgi:hypothetical protein